MTNQYTQPAIMERGGTGVGPGSMGKNYMQYISGGSYDDDQYSLYASANYGSETARDKPPSSLAMRDPSSLMPPNMQSNPNVPNTDPSHSQKGFKVLNATEIPRSNYFTCPTCNVLAIKSCSCQYKDASCPNGHAWFLLDGKKQSGISPNHK